MKEQRGSPPRHLTRAERGLLNDRVWQRTLQGYPTSLLCSIRQILRKKVPGITESFNTNSRYFGYWVGTEKDTAYIHVQKKKLRIDLCISRDFEAAIRKAGFKIRYSHNFQGRAGWLTGWQVPHSTDNIGTVMKWLCKAFLGGRR